MRIVRIVSWVGTLLIAVVAALVIVSQTRAFREWARDRVVAFANQALRGELSIDSLGGNLITGITLQGVALTLNERPVVRVERMAVAYSIPDLLGGGLPLASVTIVDPVVDVWRTESGVLNVSQLLAPGRSRGGPGPSFEIERLTVEGGTVTIGDRVVTAGGVEVPGRIVNLDAVLSLARGPGGRIEIAAERLSAKTETPSLRVVSSSGRVTIGNGEIVVNDLTLETANSDLALDARIGLAEEPPRIDAQVSAADLDFAELAPMLPVLEPYREWSPRLRLSADGPLDALAVQFELETQHGRVAADVTVDAVAPGRRVDGTVHADGLNLAAFVAFQERTAISAGATIDARLEERTVTFALAADAFGGKARAEGSVTLPDGDGPRVRYEVSGEVESVDPGRLPEPIRPPFGAETVGPPAAALGPVSFEFQLTGRGSDVDVDVALEALRVGGATFGRATAVRVTRRAGRSEYAAQGTVQNLDLQRLGEALGIEALRREDLASDIDAKFDIERFASGEEGLTLRGSAMLVDSAVANIQLSEFDADVRIDSGAGTIAVEGRFTDINPGAVLNQPGLQGAVDGTIEARVQVTEVGTAAFNWRTDMDAAGRLAVAQARIANIAIAQAIADLAYEDEVLMVRELVVTGPDLGATAEGRLALNRTGQSSLTYSVDTPPLSRIDAFTTPMRGEALLDGSITGNLAAYHSTGTIAGSNLGYGDYGALSLAGTYAVSVPELDLSRSSVTASLEADRVALGNRVLRTVSASATYTAPQLTFRTTLTDGQRTVETDGQLVVHPDHQEVHLPRIRLTTNGAEWRLPDDHETTIRYGADRLLIDGLLLTSAAAGRVAVDGGIGVGAASPLRITVTNFPVAVVDDLVLEGREASGTLDVTAAVSGSMGEPIVTAQFALTGGTVAGFAFDRLGGAIDYAGGREIDLDVRLDVAPDAWLTATGTVPLSNTGTAEALAVRVQSPGVGLAVIDALTDEITDASGTIAADVLVTGSYQDPRVSGGLNVSQGALTITATGSRYTGIDTRIMLSPDLITVPAFTVRDDEGHGMRISGELGYRPGQARRLAVAVESNEFEVIDNALAEIEVDTDLRISGEILRPHIEGRIEVGESTVHIDRLLELLDTDYATTASTTQGVAEASDTAAIPPQGGGSGSLALSADIQLAVPDSLRLEGTDLQPPGNSAAFSVGDANITIGGDLRVRKSAGEPFTLTGELHPVRGTYEFQGRQFNLQRGGAITFAGVDEVNPTLSLTATREVSGIETRVVVGGTLRQPTLTLSSDPPLEEADILSLIVFNQPMNMLGTGEQVSLARRAAGLAAGYLTSQLAESIGNALEIDVFELQVGGDSLTPSVTVAEQLAEGVYLRIRQQFGAASRSTAALEYQLTDWLRLEGKLSHGDAAAERRLLQRTDGSGISLLFRFGY